MSTGGKASWGDRVQSFVSDWFHKLDQHVPVESLLPMVSDTVEFQFPEGPVHGADGFRRWYEGVTNIFFDEVHELRWVNVQYKDEATAEVRLVVKWEAHRWKGPAPRSQSLAFDALQTWTVQRAPANGEPVITHYIVEALLPLPGSAPL
jgi:SnoaL-like domain